ncbi:sulfite exporter TauE/SafE family protein [uncultured Desulfuromusa sp.]|uniref:sulfite exporter TauE/SafE family protein n=1 Tax=uncultured Desulfuromusa sp. TaxID=219183 RepID=UPI002AA5F3D1|nr:sulfite exporter TauE/SafE family protein [uncultured Desulfuromusa sp.]
MDWIDYTFILIAYVAAAGIKGLTGVGFSTSCLSIMALRLDLKVAIPLVIFPSVVSNVGIMIQAGHFREALRRFWLFYLAAIPGLVIGLSILVVVNVSVAKALLGLILTTYAIWALSNKSFSLSTQWERHLKFPAGFLTGFVNGLTGSQVMPSLPYLLSLDIDRNLFVQAINISFTLSSLVMLVGMKYWGYLPPSTSMVAVGGIIPVLIALYLSGEMRKKLTGKVHRRLVLMFLLVTGSILVLKALVSVFGLEL